MKPPSQKAVDRALAILIQSINEENGTNFAAQSSQPKSGSTISQLDANVQALQIAHESIVHTTLTWIATIRKPRNALIPLRQLPVELIAEIILASLRMADGTNMRQLQRLASVCTLWWDIVLSFPRFWTTISSPEALSMKLRRSGSAPLILALHCSDQVTADRMLRLGGGHIRRWKRVHTSDLGTKALMSWLAGSAPRQQWAPDHPGESLRPRWDLARLTSLHIADIALSASVPTAIKIVDVLRCCPVMESIEIHGFNPSLAFADLKDEEEPDAAAEWTGQAEIPRLRRLVLSGLGSRPIRIIISGIRADGLVDLQVTELTRWPVLHAERPALLTDQCRSLVHSVLNNISARLVVVTVKPLNLTISHEVEGGRGKLQLRCLDPDISIIGNLCQLLPTTVNVDLRVLLGKYEMTERDRTIVNTVFNRVHRIESLSLMLPYSFMAQALKAFSAPYPQFHQGNGDVWWPGHGLVKLTISVSMVEGGQYFQAISDTVEEITSLSRLQAAGTKRQELQAFDEDGRKFVLSDRGDLWI